MSLPYLVGRSHDSGVNSAMRTIRLIATLMALTLTFAACGGDSDTGDGDGGASSIEVSGSSTVEPITALVAEDFRADNPSIAISVEGPGTGDGFARFCNGETDVSDASRPIKDSEAQDCADNGIEYVELHIATDGIAVITSAASEAVACLDYNDLYALVGPEAEGFENWNDADALAAELGATNAPYLAAPLVITAPGEESGTYDTFVELVIEDIADERGQEVATRVDYEASGNDNVIIQGISGNDTSLGWVGYAFFAENTDVLRAIPIDGGAGCVEPTADTIATFDYPLSRPLFIYVNTAKAAENPALSDFIDFYLSADGLASVSEAGYVDLTDAGIASTRDAWSNR